MKVAVKPISSLRHIQMVTKPNRRMGSALAGIGGREGVTARVEIRRKWYVGNGEDNYWAGKQGW